MKLNFKKLIGIILITFLIGNIFTLFTIDNTYYKSLVKPFFIPPIIFPITWSTLYLLMSISLYRVTESIDVRKKECIVYYFIQLIVNSLWTLFFFGLNFIGFSFIWCVLLLVLVIIMSSKFYLVDKISAYLNVPYILWLIFASFLNLSILLLN